MHRALLPELARRYHLRPADLDDMCAAELAVFIADLQRARVAEADARRVAVEDMSKPLRRVTTVYIAP